ncbi:Zinc finger, RING/FYVE/PHD-type [Ostreococcus tauri]|uniref:Zinc finger, RING/FYVE/PHD-type n=1 Tax=Ostreococcus tauri TaxID=70448 RepID=Q00WX5_OSTTA|nr:Zinc finger, RING/FYVE/PHD-type [Ostreococcus tauri]OUS46305.1 hypothetical protein BE221DRAFT_146022 [Ostreococcus tauri]CAL56536.1 Zinc finger, RING/FYVE/PHD-type [Ostreococcus tauri]|eukprot:XP_003082679.1 Zinc finger, RING/FYVE/PHD-type [Ostreococcus tauri]
MHDVDAIDDAVKRLKSKATFIDACHDIETIARARVGDENDGVLIDSLMSSSKRVDTTLRARYGDGATTEWSVGASVLEAIARAVERSTRDDGGVCAAAAARAKAKAESDASAGNRMRAVKGDKIAFEGQFTRDASTLDVEGASETSDSVNEALRLILAARRRFTLEVGDERQLMERFASTLGVSGDGAGERHAASTVSIEALRYRKPTEKETSDGKCAICFDGYAAHDSVISMPCAATHSFHEACVKEWLLRDDSCPLCRSSLPVWLGRPLYQ